MTMLHAASRFTGKTALDDDDLRAAAPSVFAASPWGRMSRHYKMVPTIEVVGMLRDRGFVPTRASQSRSRIEGKGEFTKHMIRFRHAGLVGPLAAGDEVPELVLVNSHDGTAAYKFFSGVFRLVCANGLVVQSADFGGVSVRHNGGSDFHQRVTDATCEVMDEAPRTLEAIRGWKQIELTGPQRQAFSAAALELVPEKPLKPDQVLRARRTADAGRDLWTTSNVVQENVMQGGIRGLTPSGRRTTTRPVKSVGEDLRINRALWRLTEEMARLV